MTQCAKDLTPKSIDILAFFAVSLCFLADDEDKNQINVNH